MNLAIFLRETRYLIEFLLAYPAIWMVRWMPEALARGLAIVLGRLAFWLPTRRRQWCLGTDV